MKAIKLKLKPCPFCGSAAVGLYPDLLGGGQTSAGWGVQFIGCASCGAKTDTADSWQPLVSLWNMRRGENAGNDTRTNKCN